METQYSNMAIQNIRSSDTELKLYRKGTVPIPTDYTLASMETLSLVSLSVGSLNNNNTKYFCYVDRILNYASGITRRYVSRAPGVAGLTVWYDNGGTPTSTTITLLTKIKDGYFTVDLKNERSNTITPIEPFTNYELHYFIFYY